ncbi:isopenicillin N synthase family dioxygenase [Rhodopila sp.]|jgi:isopenicillin N synthase-like dioxygenase|uniref:isopenicillin N synthase family dioxygenase n=1 Tax=Rhodopila sp. TaxID=2480087 RepID=UPI002CC774E8|nr:2-oxoglutarate and iron-dependent oxygenase domain-containing protein [Rhodopila sp.]HVZ10087.1 2-oxoglutarate and iron-dependent oxygenase domain-containing protein [Rhodopila sp.]
MTVYAPSLAPIRHDAPEEIPVLDIGRLRAGDPGALAALTGAFRHALEDVGFYFVVNHGVPASLIAATFQAAADFHAQPEEAKLALRINEHNIGYLPFRGSVTRHSQLNANNRPNLVEAFFIKREITASAPLAPFRAPNRWPENVPGFRAATLAYCDAMEALGKSLLPLYASALGLAPDWFDAAFAQPMYTLRLSHYPRQDVVEDNEFGLAPHSDTSFMTMLAQNDVPGLSIRLPNGRWIDAPALPGSILVNGGDLLRRWTNDRFLATPHRVINRSGRERYAIPFFMDCSYDWRMACVPTCLGTDEKPKYDPITYPEYMTWFRNQNYAAAVQGTRQPAAGA